MSLNKGKAKVKTKSKSTAKSAGKNKAAVMNSRNPKKPMAISGDTMSNYAMYKKGGTTKKKYEVGGDSNSGTSTTGTRYVRVKIKNGKEREKEISEKRYNRIKDRLTNRAGTIGYTDTENDRWEGMTVDTEAYLNKSGKKGIGSRSVTYKKGGATKLKKYQATNSQVITESPTLRFQNTDPNAANYNVAPASTNASKEMRDRFIEMGKTWKKEQEQKKAEEGTLKGGIKKLFGLYKKGGTTKVKKFAALAPPYNKATAADRIAGAKKNSRKK